MTKEHSKELSALFDELQKLYAREREIKQRIGQIHAIENEQAKIKKHGRK